MINRQEITNVSLADVALEAGVSRAAACYALQNRPKVSVATRERVLGVAKRLGYVPDARVATWLAQVRRAKQRDVLPIAWLNTQPEKNAWRRHSYLFPFLDGAEKKACELGYRIDDIWASQPGMTMRRMAQILYQRNVEGIIISTPARHFRLDWKSVAAVRLGRGLLAPRLHQVSGDVHFNFLLALKMARRHGYRRIGVCLEERVDRWHAYHAIQATIHYLNSSANKSDRIRPLFYKWIGLTGGNAPQSIIRWLRTERPDVVICHDNHLVDLATSAGFDVPGELGVIHLATDDDVKDWAGIDANKRSMGAQAVEQVVSLLQARRLGIPDHETNTIIRGTWHPGRTLLIPKPGR